jgi:hypothetical protein
MDVKKKDELVKELRNFRYLKIERVPTPTFELFRKIAHEAYAGDYGMFLKDLLDRFVDDLKYQALISRMQSIEEKIGGKDPVVREIILNNGKTIRIKKERGGEK